MDAVKAKTAALRQTIGSIRNVGIGMAVAGGAGILTSKHFQKEAEADLGDTLQMEAMLRKRGYADQIDSMKDWVKKQTIDAALPDDEPIKKATSQLLSFGLSPERIKALMPGFIGQARLMANRNGTGVMDEITGVAMQGGKAYASGNAGMLKRAGVTLSESDLQYVKDANTEIEKQGRLFEVVKRSLDQYALGMRDGLTQAQIEANHLSFQMDEVTTNIGEGAQRAQQSINGMASAILRVVQASPDMQKTAGYLWTIGSYALAGVGSVISIGSQAAITAIYLKSMGITGATAMTAIQAGSARVIPMLVGTRIAAMGTAASFAALALAATVAVAAILWAYYSWEKHKDAILNPTTSTKDKRSSSEQSDDAQRTQQVDEIREKSKGLNARDRYVVLRRATAAYADLRETDKGAATATEADKLRVQMRKQGLPNYKTATSKEGKSLLAQLKGLNAGANALANKGGANTDFKGYQKSQSSDMDQLDKIQSDISKVNANLANQPPMLGNVDLPGGLPLSGAAPGLSSSLGDADGVDPYADQIRQLTRQKRDLKGKKNAAAREALQAQIDELKDKERDWKSTHAQSLKEKRAQESASKKAKAEDARAEKLAQRERGKQNASDNNDAEMLAKIDVAAKYETQIGALEDQLDAARDEQNAAKVRALTLQIEQAKARQKYEEEMVEAGGEKNAAHKAALEAAAKKHFDNALAASQRIAKNAAGDVEKDLARDAERALKKGRGKKTKSDKSEENKENNDAAIRGQLAMVRMGNVSSPILGVGMGMSRASALGAGINYGDRFAESDAMRPRYNAAPLSSFQTYNMNSTAQMNIGMLGVPEVAGQPQGKARVKSQRQNALGQILVQFEELALDVPRIGDLRGRGGRR